jgi:hypothetical protein
MLVASVLCWGTETKEKTKYEHGNVNTAGEDQRLTGDHD